jgi:hypothetical protein
MGGDQDRRPQLRQHNESATIWFQNPEAAAPKLASRPSTMGQADCSAQPTMIAVNAGLSSRSDRQRSLSWPAAGRGHSNRNAAQNRGRTSTQPDTAAREAVQHVWEQRPLTIDVSLVVICWDDSSATVPPVAPPAACPTRHTTIDAKTKLAPHRTASWH